MHLVCDNGENMKTFLNADDEIFSTDDSHCFNDVSPCSISEQGQDLQEKNLFDCHIKDIKEIRIFANPGRGYGHQCVVFTLIEKLRDLGFLGVVEILANDKIGNEIWEYNIHSNRMEFSYINCDPMVSGVLIKMLPELASSYNHNGKIINVPSLGKVRLLSYHKKMDLPQVDLTICAADDFCMNVQEKVTEFNTKCYILLQPTDWLATRSIGLGKEITQLPEEMRLSCDRELQLPSRPITNNEEEINLLDIVDNPDLCCLFIYGCYFDKPALHKCNLVSLQLIERAVITIGDDIEKTIVLLLPQHTVYSEMLAYGKNIKFKYTDCLRKEIFDYMMLHATPIVEGRNSVNACESSGVPFIHAFGFGSSDATRSYSVQNEEMQTLHKSASFCLEGGDESYLPALVAYMKKALCRDEELSKYHKERRERFLERPDACELAFNKIGVRYDQSSL